MQALRRLQAERRLQAGGAQSPSHHAAKTSLQNFCIDIFTRCSKGGAKAPPSSRVVPSLRRFVGWSFRLSALKPRSLDLTPKSPELKPRSLELKLKSQELNAAEPETEAKDPGANSSTRPRS